MKIFQLTKSHLSNLIKPFADYNMLQNILRRFHLEGITKLQDDNLLTLTEKGQQLHKLCFEQQQLFRQKAMMGLSEQDHQNTISTLQKNLQRILAWPGNNFAYSSFLS